MLLINIFEFILDHVVVWTISIFQTLEVVKYISNLLNVFRCYPKIFFRILEALGFDFFDLVLITLV